MANNPSLEISASPKPTNTRPAALAVKGTTSIIGIISAIPAASTAIMYLLWPFTNTISLGFRKRSIKRAGLCMTDNPFFRLSPQILRDNNHSGNQKCARPASNCRAIISTNTATSVGMPGISPMRGARVINPARSSSGPKDRRPTICKSWPREISLSSTAETI